MLLLLLLRRGARPEFFTGGPGAVADPEAMYHLFDFKNYITKIMS